MKVRSIVLLQRAWIKNKGLLIKRSMQSLKGQKLNNLIKSWERN